MKFIDPSWEIIEQKPGLIGIYEQIERAARVSYKSEDKITEGSAQRMVDTLIKNKHYACLEHGTVYLKVPSDDPKNFDYYRDYKNNPYSKIVCVNRDLYITTNARVLVENEWLDDLKYLCKPTEYHERRIAVKFTTSIGIVREMLRHRKFSFMNESTRYCNYSKGKFNSELTCIIPQWIYDCRNHIAQFVDPLDGSSREWLLKESGDSLISHLVCMDRTVSSYIDILERIEEDYIYYVTDPDGYTLKPQEARGILPLDLKSELVMTGFISDWIHFFKLRSYVAETGKPHPDIEFLANSLLLEFLTRGYCTLEEIKDEQTEENN